MGEIAYSAGFLEWYAEEAKRTYGDVLPAYVSSKRQMCIRQPIGVSGMITPVSELNGRDVSQDIHHTFTI